ncbi:MAG: dienelactone hydrolase family protein [Methanobacteriota archaeon]|nr:MAG: dienelactone hydrolase family protein [Euryarchaeota archaeon]
MRTVGTRRRGVPISPSMISGRMVEYAGFSESVPAYLARPSDDHVRPEVVVIHALFGLVDHTKDVADRVAREGYVALAPNLFGTTELAGVLTPENVQKAMRLLFRLPRRDPELAREEIAKLPETERSIVGPTVEKLLGGLPKDRFVKDLVAAVDYLGTLPSVRRDRIGSVGFCFGGGLSASLACETSLRASVIFYGENPSPIDRVRSIDGAILGLYGADDTRINADLDKLVKAMTEYKKDFEMRIYPGAPHNFFDDTNGTTYREAAAKDAWDRVLRFYRRTLMA